MRTPIFTVAVSSFLNNGLLRWRDLIPIHSVECGVKISVFFRIYSASAAAAEQQQQQHTDIESSRAARCRSGSEQMKEAQDHGDTSRAHLLGIIVELGCVRHVHDPESEGDRLLCNSSNGKSLKGDAHRSNRHARTLGGTFAIGIVAVRSSVLVTLAANLGGVWALSTACRIFPVRIRRLHFRGCGN